ncbi:DUF4174 domain-containing protein [Neorhizobium sp. P12A]|uniref:DUF4174 domain-containing protein n=1 Tax=Neorhizobium sp. P12A TaxID=2268027 RepID=UPI0011ED519F|nr:DUF4174 domain-containing protein [Neorhizobium sp. P12A]KAA0699568.1 DUF4174 domain-containing protein [Neorhizobium sp. P12A]
MTKSLLYGATKVDETSGAYAPVASLDQFQWKNRVLIVFSDENNARAARQENLLLAQRNDLEERDMIILRLRGDAVSFLFGSGQDIDGQAIRRDLDRPEDGEFAMVLIGKDGTVKLRAAEPVVADELFAIIDSMPVRAAEPGPQTQQ